MKYLFLTDLILLGTLFAGFLVAQFYSAVLLDNVQSQYTVIVTSQNLRHVSFDAHFQLCHRCYTMTIQVLRSSFEQEFSFSVTHFDLLFYNTIISNDLKSKYIK